MERIAFFHKNHTSIFIDLEFIFSIPSSDTIRDFWIIFIVGFESYDLLADPNILKDRDLSDLLEFWCVVVNVDDFNDNLFFWNEKLKQNYSNHFVIDVKKASLVHFTNVLKTSQFYVIYYFPWIAIRRLLYVFITIFESFITFDVSLLFGFPLSCALTWNSYFGVVSKSSCFAVLNSPLSMLRLKWSWFCPAMIVYAMSALTPISLSVAWICCKVDKRIMILMRQVGYK